MRRSPILSRLAPLGLFLVIGCDGIVPANSASPDNSPSPAAAPVNPCLSDPDLPGTVVCDSGSEWTCVTQGTMVQCQKGSYDIPGGTADQWDCVDQGEFTECVAVTDDAPTNNPGWTCSRNEQGKIVCLSQGGDQPGLGGPWDCVYDDVSGVTCTSSDSSGGGSGTGTGGDTTGGGSGTGTGGDAPGGGSGTGTDTGTGDSGTSTPAFSCSYAMIVFSYGGEIYVIKIGQDLACTGVNETSKDAVFTTTCDGASYDNSGFIMNRDGSPITGYPGPPPCSELFTITSHSATAVAGVTILFAVAHNGSFPNHFAEICPPAGGSSSVEFPPICTPQ